MGGALGGGDHEAGAPWRRRGALPRCRAERRAAIGAKGGLKNHSGETHDQLCRPWLFVAEGMTMSHEHHHHSEAEHNSPHAGHVNHFEAKNRVSTAGEGVIYTCPMHPQIRQVGPGACPICGMTLEPLVSTAESEPSAELADMTRRFWIGLALTIPVFVLEMGGHFLDLHRFIPPQTSNWLQFALASPVVLWAGWPFFARAGRSLVTRNLNMFTLIAMGTGVAWAVQRRGDIGSFCFPARVPRQRRLGPDLFRGGRGHHRAGAARTGPRIARPRKDGRRDPRAARSRAQDGAADRGRRSG